MTNEQLAILLKGIVTNLSSIYAGLNFDLEGFDLPREKYDRYVWIGEGQEPVFQLFLDKSKSPDYKKGEPMEGKFLCLFSLEDYINSLQSDIDRLLGKE